GQDIIQRHHADGLFYEAEELAIMARHFPVGGSLLDIGANVGNHCLYALLFLHAAKVVPVEPNLVAAELLVANLVLNGVERRADLRWLGHGVGRAAGQGYGVQWKKRNLGGGRLSPGTGDIPLVTGADVIGDDQFDMIKIDVEGMELDVLEGLMPALIEHRPPIFVEVGEERVQDFEALIGGFGYRIEATYKRYPENCNFLISGHPKADLEVKQ
ncbi:MAG: FkbM family methyltransferase, partial [Pseudomonadota bacterium]